MSFDDSLDTLLVNEGYYSNHPNDKGGETWRGVARNFHPDWEGWEIIDKEADKKALETNNELAELVKKFYYKNYWGKLSVIKNERLQTNVFDCEVLFGRTQGVKILQRALNVLRYNSLITDGILGSKTEKAANEYPHQESLIFTFIGERYVKIRNGQREFRRGWINRAFKL